MAETVEALWARLQALPLRQNHLRWVLQRTRCEALLRRMQGQDADTIGMLLPPLQQQIEQLECMLADVLPAASASPTASSCRDRDLAGLLDALADNAALETAGEPLDAVLDAARAQWRTLRAQAQLQQMLEQPQEDAGPLNSGRLVARAMEQLQQIAPAYLSYFLAYLDTLAGLVPLAGQPADAVAVVLPGRKPARGASRKRKPSTEPGED